MSKEKALVLTSAKDENRFPLLNRLMLTYVLPTPQKNGAEKEDEHPKLSPNDSADPVPTFACRSKHPNLVDACQTQGLENCFDF